MKNITAPFGIDQMIAIKNWQEAGCVHELTCDKGHTLSPTVNGMVCICCDGYLQKWVPECCVDDTLPNIQKALNLLKP